MNFKCGHLRDEANTYWSIQKPACRRCSIDRSKATWRDRKKKSEAIGTLGEFCLRCQNHEGRNCPGGCYRPCSTSEAAKACRCGVSWSLTYPRELEACRSVFIIHTGVR